jgi:hypothetical protein
MLIAHYIGNHAKDSFSVRCGWWLTRKAQKGPYGGVTHCEAIHEVFDNGSVTIASASLRDGGVRAKNTWLTPGNWLVVDVPAWDVRASAALLFRTAGQPYDLRGAIATELPGCPQEGRWFCNEWVGYPYLKAPATFGPHQFAAITLSLGKDVTTEFMAERVKLTPAG